MASDRQPVTATLGPAACACRCAPVSRGPEHEVVIAHGESGVNSEADVAVAALPMSSSQIGEAQRVAVVPVTSASKENSVLAHAAASRVVEALRVGRVLEARRGIQSLEAVGCPDISALVGAAALERTRRTAARFDKSLEEVMPSLLPSDGWVTEEAPEEGMQFAYRLVGDGLFHLMSTTRYEGCSAVQALAALCEYDLCPAFNLDVRDVACIGEHGLVDSAWHVSKHTMGGSEDSVLHVSCIDALEERGFSALWASVYTPSNAPDTHAEPLLPGGMRPPPMREGHIRQALVRNTFRIVPLRTTRSGQPAFDMHLSLLSRPNEATHKTLVSYSVSAMKQLIRDQLGTFPPNFRRHVLGEALNQRIMTSSRAPLYEVIRRHLAVWHNPMEVARPSHLQPRTSSSAVHTDSPRDGAAKGDRLVADDTDTAKDHTVPAFEGFSEQLPERWAD